VSEPTIREATVADVPSILRVAERAWNAAYGDILPQACIDTAMGEWYDGETTRELLERDGIVYLVAELDGELVGYLNGGPSDEEGVARLGALYVDPERWGEGVGTALLETFETVERERGTDALRFRVLSANTVGTSFYRSHGYDAVDQAWTNLFGERVRESVFRGELD
jgi:ribosomal protein S18 acetylase RimI-like enzyme